MSPPFSLTQDKLGFIAVQNPLHRGLERLSSNVSRTPGLAELGLRELATSPSGERAFLPHSYCPMGLGTFPTSILSQNRPKRCDARRVWLCFASCAEKPGLDACRKPKRFRLMRFEA